MEPTSRICVSRILIYRLGSMGDTVVALPCFHAIRRRYPTAQIVVLTSLFEDPRAIGMSALLDGTGLVDDYITYKIGTRDYKILGAVREKIRSFNPDLLIYLAQPRGEGVIGGYLKASRDYLFFRWCGIRRFAGVPFSRDQRENRAPRTDNGLWEPEAQRLARCIDPLVTADITDKTSWSLCLTDAELENARSLVNIQSSSRRLGLTIGARFAAKDWGVKNWRAVLNCIADPALGLVLLGSTSDLAKTNDVAAGWPGPVLNLCGQTSPRVSAAVIQHLDLLLCHDSGPMHLAAAVQTPCVAIFSRIARPGVWFPCGSAHRVFYPDCEPFSIEAIQPLDVIKAVRHALRG